MLPISLLTPVSNQRSFYFTVLYYCARALVAFSVALFALFQLCTSDRLCTLVFSITGSRSARTGASSAGHIINSRFGLHISAELILEPNCFICSVQEYFPWILFHLLRTCIVRDSNRNTTSFPRARALFHPSLFWKIRIPCARARVISNLFFLVAPNCVTFDFRSRIRVEVCGVLQLSLSLVFFAHITIPRHRSHDQTNSS